MLRPGLNNFMRILFLMALLTGCGTGPSTDASFRSEKSPMAAALAGEEVPDGGLTGANQRNTERTRTGDWRAVRPAVGPTE
jgi:hypothetical protein